MEIRPAADQILEERASQYLDMIERLAVAHDGNRLTTALALIAAAIMDVSYEINEK
jgi:hypothetical protein